MQNDESCEICVEVIVMQVCKGIAVDSMVNYSQDRDVETMGTRPRL